MVDLTQTFRWPNPPAEQLAVLDDLQPNIIKAHVRDSLHVLFLNFADGDTARGFLAALVPKLKSATTHLTEVDAFTGPPPGQAPQPGTSYVGVGLTARCYALLGIADAATPQDIAFRRGMSDPVGVGELQDPPVSTWDPAYRQVTNAQAIHAVVLVGDTDDAVVEPRYQEVLALCTAGVTVLGEETGIGRHNANGDGIEHFGYVDGRSQPLFLTSDVTKETATGGGTTVWDPRFPVERVLVPDPAAPDPTVHFGSYFVFRKLEQNVRRFKQSEELLADALGLVGEDRERAGALIIGRFEDGTPVVLQDEAGAHHPVMNDFDYDSDDGRDDEIDGDTELRGSKCPVHAHIRKTNPRSTAPGERNHIMARRGQTYGERADDPTADLPVEQRPTGGVGLLFMAFNANINVDGSIPADQRQQAFFQKSQFDFTQRIWANNDSFPDKDAGLDAVIGQGIRSPQSYPVAWGGAVDKDAAAPAQAVRMRGGEYFFMPSLAFLKGLQP
jgi:deferrochelatase/peroxidase EfeB